MCAAYPKKKCALGRKHKSVLCSGGVEVETLHGRLNIPELLSWLILFIAVYLRKQNVRSVPLKESALRACVCIRTKEIRSVENSKSVVLRWLARVNLAAKPLVQILTRPRTYPSLYYFLLITDSWDPHGGGELTGQHSEKYEAVRFSGDRIIIELSI